MVNNYIKVSLPTGRDIFINIAQITTICQDPTQPAKVQIYLSDSLRYDFVGKVEDVLKLLEVSTRQFVLK